MNSTNVRTDHDIARDRIETAWQRYPTCTSCGSPMSVELDGGSLWIECTSFRGLTGLRRALASGFHDRHRIDVESDTLLAAAA